MDVHGVGRGADIPFSCRKGVPLSYSQLKRTSDAFRAQQVWRVSR